MAKRKRIANRSKPKVTGRKRSISCDFVPPSGQDLFETFHALPPRECYEKAVNWPKNQGVIGRANGIAYRSDKWDRKERDFHHEHCHPLPQILTQYRKGLSVSRRKKPFSEPDTFVVLGECLDIGLEPGTFNAKALGITPDKDGNGLIDYMANGEMPLLCACPKRRMLVVVPRRLDQHPLILWSPILTVEAHGIIY
jgi:hypothetical protein